MDIRDVVLAVVALIGAGGGLTAFLKLKPERANIAVASAETVVIMQSGELARVYKRMEDLDKRVEHFEALEDRVVELEKESSRLLSKRDALQIENIKLRERVQHLEEKVESLENGST